MRNDLKLKESLIQRLEAEINDLNKLIEHKKHEHLEQVSRLINDHKEHKQNWDVQRDQHQLRIQV
jgi:hypothetical protein